jgi:hypothetical protein
MTRDATVPPAARIFSANTHRVDDESPSQFNREYQRLFGLPPVLDLVRIRATNIVIDAGR